MLNVFFVRPANNGYYRIAEALLDQPRADVRVRTSLFRSTQFPLTYPLPGRLDGQMQGWHGLEAYDLLVLAGIDPEVLTPKEMRDIVAFVEHGGGLLTTGGTVSGSGRVGTYEPLAAALPVEVGFAEDVVVEAPARAGPAHPVTHGLPPFTGRVQRVHAVTPKAGAQVLLEVNGQPLLVAGERGCGRTLYLNTYPLCSVAVEGSFFADRSYPDLIRQAALWLTGAEARLLFDAVAVPEAVSPGETVRLEARCAPGGVATMAAALRANGQTLAAASVAVAPSGVAVVDLEVPSTPDLPATVLLTLEGRDAGGAALAFRGVAVAVRPEIDLVLEPQAGVEALAPGMELVMAWSLTDRRGQRSGLAFGAQVLDPHGAVLHTWDQLPPAAEPLRWTVGLLCSGTYTLRASLAEADGGRILRTCVRTFEVVDPPDNEHYFPFVTEALPDGDGVCVSAEDLAAMVDDAAAHGFTAMSLGGADHSEPLTNLQRVRRQGERHAQARGLRLVVPFVHLVPSYSRTAPPEVCVYSPEFDRALAAQAGPLLEQGRKIARLFMMEILDEPLVAGPMICRCPRCLARFHAAHGYPMPDWDESCRPGAEAARTDLLQFVSDYWAEVFRRVYRFKQDSGVSFDVHHTFCQLTFGSFVSSYYWRDGFAWTPYCDRFDWDVYPYIYPIWRGHLELRCPNLRYHFAGHRSLARYHGKPMGHWLDLSDRNVPHWVPPVRASSELLYTAIGQDAKLVRTFYNLTFGRNNGARRERWDDLGAELRKVGRCAAVLTQVHKVPARLAMLFPATDWALRHHTHAEDLPPGTPAADFPVKWDEAPLDDSFPFAGTPYNAFELLLRAFGEADLIPEPMVVAGGLQHHRALALWGTRYLGRQAAQAIVRFVHDGGLLLGDGIADRDERGQPLDEMADLFGTRFEPLCDDLAATTAQVGRGATLLFNAEVNAAYTGAVLAHDDRLRQALEGAIWDFLAQHGVVSHARPANPEFEVDLLEGEGCFLLVVVNHNDRDDETRVELLDPPSSVGFVVDMASGEPVAVEARDGHRWLHLRLGERRGIILGVYPRQPVGHALTLAAPSCRRGEPLCYQVQVLDQAGQPAPGSHPVEITVRDAAGQVRTRYGGSRATRAGRYARQTPLALNEVPGTWEIEVRDPLTRTVSRGRFRVD
ncbi:MAG: glutamine amidotransferase [Candidatus Latescibacterota bacterium]|jgi:hypothetical protein